MGYKILKIDGTLFFESTKDNIRDAVIEKYNIDKDFSFAVIQDADLSELDLRYSSFYTVVSTNRRTYLCIGLTNA